MNNDSKTALHADKQEIVASCREKPPTRMSADKELINERTTIKAK